MVKHRYFQLFNGGYMEIERKTISVEEAGQVLGVSRPKAYELVNQGIIPVLKLGPHKFVVPIAALEKYLANAGSEVLEN